MSLENNTPLISVIIPSYNYGHFISDTLKSLLAQTYSNWEAIIIDDGSTDNTKEIVKEFLRKDTRFRYFYQPNQGQSKAKDTGLKQVRGEFIQYLDADDMIESKKFENQVNIFLSDPSIDIVYGNVRFFSDGNLDERLYSMEPENKPWMTEFTGQGHDLLPYIIKGNTMVINSPLFKTSLIDEVGMFINNKGFNEDWDFWLRCAFKNKIFHYDDNDSSWALVRFHPGSTSKKTLKMFHAGLQVRQQIRKYLNEIKNVAKYNELYSINEEYFNAFLQKSIAMQLQNKDYIGVLIFIMQMTFKERSLRIIKALVKQIKNYITKK